MHRVQVFHQTHLAQRRALEVGLADAAVGPVSGRGVDLSGADVSFLGKEKRLPVACGDQDVVRRPEQYASYAAPRVRWVDEDEEHLAGLGVDGGEADDAVRAVGRDQQRVG